MQPAARPVAVPAPEVSAETAAEAATGGELAQGIPMSPVKGSEIPLEKVPSAVGQVSSVDIERTGSPAIEQAIQQYVPGAITSDVTGNPFSTDRRSISRLHSLAGRRHAPGARRLSERRSA